MTLYGSMPAYSHSASPLNYITREKGLAGESVNKIIIDHRGIIWIATSNGVNYFDGIHPVKVPVNDQMGDNHMVFDICEDHQHNLFISTPTGLYCLKKDGAAFQYMESLESKTSLLCVDSVLYLFNREGIKTCKNNVIKPFDIGKEFEGLIVRSIASDNDGSLWLLSDQKLLHLKDHRVTNSYPLTDYCPKGTPFSQVIVCGKRIFMATKGAGLFAFDPITQQVTHVEGIGNMVNALSDGGNNRLCVASDGAGAYLLNTKTGEIEKHLTYGTGNGDLPTDAVYCYVHDKQGIDWIGMSRYGMAYSYRMTPLAKIYSFKDFSTEGMSVRNFCVNGSDLLIGTHNGLFFVKEDKGVVQHFTPQQLGGGHIVTDIVRYGDKYYVATFDGGLWQINPYNMQLDRIHVNTDLSNLSIGVLRVSPDNKLWIGTSNGIYVLDSLGIVTVYNDNNLRMKIVSVSDILFDKEGNTWVCGNQGIAIFDWQSGRFVDNLFPENFFNQAGYLRGCLGHDSIMYFGNKSVYFTNSKMTEYGQLSIPKELMEESVGDLLADHLGGLWMATEKGLFRFFRGPEVVQHFGYSEGIRNSMIGRSSLRMSGNNTLWFATAEGLQYMTMSDVEQWVNKVHSKVWLHDIIKGEHTLSPTEILNCNEEHHLSLSWNMGAEHLRMKVALQDYAKPEGRFFQYKLDNSKTWNVVNYNEDIVISGLFLGNHQLIIRLMGVEGTETVYSIRVYPSKTAIAITVLLFVSALLLLLLRRERKSSHDLRDERDLVEEALIETEEELNHVEQKTVRLEASSPKYQHMRLSDEECADIVARMREWLESSKAYVNPELKRSDIADHIKVPVAKLSQIFTLYLKENYYDFINTYRLAEFKRLIDNGDYKRYTLTALSEQCGFKKSSFFSTFRKQEGMTPTEYLKRQNIKIKL